MNIEHWKSGYFSILCMNDEREKESGVFGWNAIVHSILRIYRLGMSVEAVSNSHWKTLATTNARAIILTIEIRPFHLLTSLLQMDHILFCTRYICPLFQDDTRFKPNKKINFFHSIICRNVPSLNAFPFYFDKQATDIQQLFPIIVNWDWKKSFKISKVFYRWIGLNEGMNESEQII